MVVASGGQGPQPSFRMVRGQLSGLWYAAPWWMDSRSEGFFQAGPDLQVLT